MCTCAVSIPAPAGIWIVCGIGVPSTAHVTVVDDATGAPVDASRMVSDTASARTVGQVIPANFEQPAMDEHRSVIETYFRIE